MSGWITGATVAAGGLGYMGAKGSASDATTAAKDSSATASNILQGAADDSNFMLGNLYGDATNYLNPYSAAGGGATNQFLANLGITPDYSGYIQAAPKIDQYTIQPLQDRQRDLAQQFRNDINRNTAAEVFIGAEKAFGVDNWSDVTDEMIIERFADPSTRNDHSAWKQWGRRSEGHEIADLQRKIDDYQTQAEAAMQANNQKVQQVQQQATTAQDAAAPAPDPFSAPAPFEFDPFSFDPSTVTLDPGYLFGLREGEKALDRKLSAMGMRDSGAAVKDAMRYNQGYATDEYGNAYNRAYGQAMDEYQTDYLTSMDEYKSRYGTAMDEYKSEYGQWMDQQNYLAGLTGMGQGVNTNLANLAMMYGTGYGNNLMTGAGANAQNVMNAGNLSATAAMGKSNSFMDMLGLGVGMYQGYQTGKLADK